MGPPTTRASCDSDFQAHTNTSSSERLSKCHGCTPETASTDQGNCSSSVRVLPRDVPCGGSVHPQPDVQGNSRQSLHSASIKPASCDRHPKDNLVRGSVGSGSDARGDPSISHRRDTTESPFVDHNVFDRIPREVQASGSIGSHQDDHENPRESFRRVSARRAFVDDDDSDRSSREVRVRRRVGSQRDPSGGARNSLRRVKQDGSGSGHRGVQMRGSPGPKHEGHDNLCKSLRRVSARHGSVSGDDSDRQSRELNVRGRVGSQRDARGSSAGVIRRPSRRNERDIEVRGSVGSRRGLDGHPRKSLRRVSRFSPPDDQDGADGRGIQVRGTVGSQRDGHEHRRTSLRRVPARDKLDQDGSDSSTRGPHVRSSVHVRGSVGSQRDPFGDARSSLRRVSAKPCFVDEGGSDIQVVDSNGSCLVQNSPWEGAKREPRLRAVDSSTHDAAMRRSLRPHHHGLVDRRKIPKRGRRFDIGQVDDPHRDEARDPNRNRVHNAGGSAGELRDGSDGVVCRDSRTVNAQDRNTLDVGLSQPNPVARSSASNVPCLNNNRLQDPRVPTNRTY